MRTLSIALRDKLTFESIWCEWMTCLIKLYHFFLWIELDFPLGSFSFEWVELSSYKITPTNFKFSCRWSILVALSPSLKLTALPIANITNFFKLSGESYAKATRFLVNIIKLTSVLHLYTSLRVWLRIQQVFVYVNPFFFLNLAIIKICDSVRVQWTIKKRKLYNYVCKIVIRT